MRRRHNDNNNIDVGGGRGFEVSVCEGDSSTMGAAAALRLEGGDSR